MTERDQTTTAMTKATTAKAHRNVHGPASEGNVQDNREQEEQQWQVGHPQVGSFQLFGASL